MISNYDRMFNCFTYRNVLDWIPVLRSFDCKQSGQQRITIMVIAMR